MKKRIQTVCMSIPLSDVAGRHLGILRLGDNVSRPNTVYGRLKKRWT